MGRIRAWTKRIRDWLIDKLTAWVWEGFCRSPDWLCIRAEIDLLRKQLMGGVRQAATIRVDVGRTMGAVPDLRSVEFQGEQVALSQSSAEKLRTQKVLYKTVDGELLVHVKTLEKSAGFPTVYSLHSVEERDLADGGEHEGLGKARGTLPLAEALGGDH